MRNRGNDNLGEVLYSPIKTRSSRNNHATGIKAKVDALRFDRGETEDSNAAVSSRSKSTKVKRKKKVTKNKKKASRGSISTKASDAIAAMIVSMDPGKSDMYSTVAGQNTTGTDQTPGPAVWAGARSPALSSAETTIADV